LTRQPLVRGRALDDAIEALSNAVTARHGSSGGRQLTADQLAVLAEQRWQRNFYA